MFYPQCSEVKVSNNLEGFSHIIERVVELTPARRTVLSMHLKRGLNSIVDPQVLCERLKYDGGDRLAFLVGKGPASRGVGWSGTDVKCTSVSFKGELYAKNIP